MPCSQLMEANVTSSVEVKCKKDSDDANIIDGNMIVYDPFQFKIFICNNMYFSFEQDL